MEKINKLKKIIFYYKILIFTKLPNPIRETRVLKLVFRTIPCLKFWAQIPVNPDLCPYCKDDGLHPLVYNCETQ